MRKPIGALAVAAVVGVATACTTGGTGVMAAAVPADSRVGALYLDDSDLHTCSGSVLHSAKGDLVLTAAHCVADGLDISFVPGHDGLLTDHDRAWQVDAIYLDPRWVADQDPRADYAILRVSRDDGVSLESVVGAGLNLGTAPRQGSVVTVTGYPLGIGTSPIGCEAATGVDDGYPVLECDGMVAGTSGSPWVSGTTVTGVVGGLDGGGCDDDVSFSSPFDGATSALLARAEAAGPGDVAPVALDDC